MPSTIAILRAIGSTEYIGLSTFLDQLHDSPRPDERKPWEELMGGITACEALELIIVVREESSRARNIKTLALTKLGVERLQEADEEEAERQARRRRA